MKQLVSLLFELPCVELNVAFEDDIQGVDTFESGSCGRNCLVGAVVACYGGYRCAVLAVETECRAAVAFYLAGVEDWVGVVGAEFWRFYNNVLCVGRSGKCQC